MKVLVRVKELKQDQAFRALQAKRSQHAAAVAATARARAAVVESAATYGAREDAIYAEVLGRVVGLDGVDDVHARVKQLERDHQILKDGVERCIHVEARLAGEVEAALATYQGAVKIRDKFVLITDELVSVAAAEADAKEENEVEELFSRPRARAA
ncbi:type III secretion system stalk subunit SctO [Antarcticirhabdus aurantiaca]|uniref:YscO family type III secretion system apparatus protein n=1 Tax=Antarcticirhabdus aurantiaca TaxID=2606717 RepID=A0ACD4NU12_9HYPH|nr:YscO family type III secretion system apparatus protein [Antarcticirhabdus aurantiaca]WAJ30520.1 YscO family type III secretion system apparatus protein [Jeongeuplla avenae]